MATDKFPGGMIGGIPKFNRANTEYVEKSNRTHTATIEEDFPNITATAKRLQDVCETCGENLAHFDCERCGKRTCNHCKTFSEFLTGAKFCTPECVTEAENEDYLNRKSGC